MDRILRIIRSVGAITLASLVFASHPLTLTLSFCRSRIYSVSRSWVSDGSLLRVGGNFFVDGFTWCRIGLSESLATVIDDSTIECVVRISDDRAVSVGALEMLEVSNDGGKRWISGLTVNSPILWGGGTLVPVSPRTINYPKEVVIGGIIPTDKFFDPVRAAQYVVDITASFNMAVETINEGNFFPGDIQLRVEVLPVDPVSSGNSTTVTEVATAFALKGIATNVSTNVGVHDPSKCLEFGYPVHNKWQDDPECCSIHSKASCSGGHNKVKGKICGSGSYGVAHETKCEAAAYASTNVIGIVGPSWSSNAVPAARAVSNPFQLPMVRLVKTF